MYFWLLPRLRHFKKIVKSEFFCSFHTMGFLLKIGKISSSNFSNILLEIPIFYWKNSNFFNWKNSIFFNWKNSNFFTFLLEEFQIFQFLYWKNSIFLLEEFQFFLEEFQFFLQFFTGRIPG